MNIPNRLKNMKRFIATTGIYCRSRAEAKYIIELFDIEIKRGYSFDSKRKENSAKRRFLVNFGGEWMFHYLSKDDVIDNTTVDDVKSWIKELVNPKEDLKYV